MLQKIRKSLLEEFRSYSTAEASFIFFVMICSFCITAEAAITRATANSVFLSYFNADFLPCVWLASVPLNFGIVSFYNLFLPRFGCVKMLQLSVMVGIIVNIFASIYLPYSAVLSFAFYLWKDIFVILMFQQLWSVIHASINISKAKYLYGVFFGMGGLGSVLGSLIPGLFAVSVGSERLLLFTLPFYLGIMISYMAALKAREGISHKQDITAMSSDSTDVMGGMKLIRNSLFLQFILLIVLLMQISSTILDFQFNTMLKESYEIQDIRTAFLGQFFSLVNTLNIFLQFFGAFLLVRLVGLKGAHLTIPLILATNAIAFCLFPRFSLMCFSFGSVKAFDYSIFGIIKEMLYIPLKVEEKFKAKAIIDVFIYRSSKACASLIILSLSTVTLFSLTNLLSWTLLILTILWSSIVLLLFKHYDFAVEKLI